MNNKLIIATAGSGKTTFLIKQALNNKSGKILITTFTEANEDEIRKKFIKINKCIPENVTVQTWFSFLLQHGVKPYQGTMFNSEITGLVLESGQSAKGIPESNTAKHYFTSTQKIYSDKLAKFVIKCNEKSNGAVIDRLSRIYTDIYIDEVQDLAGYDLAFLKLLFDCNSNILLVGDPRQGTYSTNNSSKNKQFKKSKITNFFDDTTLNLTKDDSTLTTNHRCIASICDYSNKLFPNLKKATSGNTNTTGHDGIYLIKESDVAAYLSKYKPMQLHYSARNTKTDEAYEVMTFGKSKGLEFLRVLIYPTEPIIKWLQNNNSDLADTSRSKLYVALTRASNSVCIVYDYNDKTQLDGIEKYSPQ